MLELRPVCENCHVDLPPHSTEAMICTYECTFCRSCVDNLLDNVCPNCGGGFCKRPIRPSINRKNNNFLGSHPASTKIVFNPIDANEHKLFAENIKTIPANKR